MVTVGKIERSLVGVRFFRPFPLNLNEDSGSGRIDRQGRGAFTPEGLPRQSVRTA